MFFSNKTKGFFVEFNDAGVLLARTSSPSGPLEIEDVAECPLNDPAALEEAIKKVQPTRSPSGYLHATVGIYPQKRVIRRHTLELKRLREQGYLGEVFTQHLRVEQDKYTMAILNAGDGSDYDLQKGVQKEVIFCGMPTEEIISTQEALLKEGIFPEHLELSSIAVLGAVIDSLNFIKSKAPTLVLEIGDDATQSFIVSSTGVEASRPIPQGLAAMVPIVQKELGLKDEESARKLFYSNTFDFTGMGPLLIKRLLKELQSSIGFYEVQTGQSVGQVVCMLLPSKTAWIEQTISSSLGIASLKLDVQAWLRSHQVTVSDAISKTVEDPRWMSLLSLIVHYSPANGVPDKAKS